MNARSLCTLALALAAMTAAACSSSSNGTGTAGTSGGTAGTSGGAAGTSGGTAGTSGSGTAGTSGGTAGTSGGIAGTTGGTAGTTGGTAGTTGGTAGTSGGTAGTTGTGGTSAAGNGGHAGTGSGGHAGTGSGGTTGTAGATGTGGSGALVCPSGATFCSGFEAAGQPAGSVYMVNAAPGDWSRDFAIDTTQHHTGSSSLLVKDQGASGSSGSAYRMLAVPATPNAFWVQFWIMGATTLGSGSHNAYAGGSIGDAPNDLMIEFAEDVGIAFNTSDADMWPTGYGRLTGGGTNPYVLPAMTWECVEISYDGPNQVQQLYINNVQLIDATGYPSAKEALTYFKFGYDGYNSPGGSIWYDDVVVAPTRIGSCPTVTKSNL